MNESQDINSLEAYINSNSQSRAIYITGLPEKIPFAELYSICSQYGEIHELIYPLAERCKAVCIYCEIESTTKIMNETKDEVLDKSKIKIIKHQGITSKILVYSSLQGNSKMEFSEIKEIMKKYGKIRNSFEIMKGEWIINYENIKSAIKCESSYHFTYKKKKDEKEITETLMFGFFKTPKNLYEEIKKTQTELCCERAMRSVELYSKDQYIKNYVDYQTGLFVQEKNYFLQFLCVFTSTSAYNEQSFLKIEDVISHKPLVMQDFLFLDEIFDKLLENNGRKLRDNIFDLLAFSLIPSLTNNFTIDFDDENINNDLDPSLLNFERNHYKTTLIKLISKLRENPENQDYINIIHKAIYALIIPMFASPYFITFNRETFLPVFSELQDNINLNENLIDRQIDRSIDKLITIIHKNTHLVPPFIANSMNYLGQDIYYLKECFLDIAFKNPTKAILYNLFHFSKPPTQCLLQKIYERLIAKSFCESLMACFNQSLRLRHEYKANKELDNSELTQQYKKSSTYYFNNEMIQYQFKQIYQTCILSQTDLDLIKHILTSDGLNPLEISPKSSNEKFYKFFLSFKTDQDQQFIYTVLGNKNKDDDIDDHQTMRISTVENVFVAQFRHLLQNSDPLPNINDDSTINNMNAIDILSFIENRGSIGKQSIRNYNCSSIKLFIKNKTPFVQIQYLLKLLPKTLLEQLDEIETLTTLSNIKNRTKNIQTDILFRQLQNLLTINKILFLDLNPSIKEKFVLKNNSVYISNPILFSSEFTKNLSIVFNIGDQNENEYAAILFEMLELTRKSPKDKISHDSPFYSEFRKFFIENKIDDKKFDDKYNFNIQYYFDKIFQECIEIQINERFKKKRKNVIKQKNIMDIDDNIDINNIEKKYDEDFDEKNFLLKKIDKLRTHNNDVIKFGQKIFTEVSIFRLVENINILMISFFNYFKEGWRGNEFGADECAFFFPLSILLCKPPNISFLCEFVSFFQNSSDLCFNRFLTLVNSRLLEAKIIYNLALESLEKKKKKDDK